MLRGQTKSTAFRTLTGRRVDEEQTAAQRGAAAQRTAATAYARSSHLASDLFGDDSVPEALANDQSEGADERRVLLRSIQDLNKAYARVHLAHLLHKEVHVPVKTRELEYKTSAQLRNATVDSPLRRQLRGRTVGPS